MRQKHCKSFFEYRQRANVHPRLKGMIITMYHSYKHPLPDFLVQYEQYMRVIKNRAERTVEQYENDIILFLCFYKAKKEGLSTLPDDHNEIDVSEMDVSYLSTVRPEHIYEFLTYVANERGNRATARARKLTALKSLFKYLTVTSHQLKDNPAKDIDSPHTRTALPKFLSLEESLELLNAVKDDTASATRERDYAILTLFLNCGLRLSELCGININDLDREFTSVRILGKGSKERMVYLNDACSDAIKSYLKVRAQDQQIKDKNALFISSRQHNRISKKTVQWLVKKYLTAAGLGQKHYSTHKLRHTAATLMYRTGKVDVRVLKDILGHEQLNTTQIYTHVSDESMREAMTENPLSSLKAELPKSTKGNNNTNNNTENKE